MISALSLKNKNIYFAANCEHWQTTEYQLCCPYCLQPLHLKKGEIVKPHFSHYDQNYVGYTECPYRADASLEIYESKKQYEYQSKGQKLLKHFAYFSHIYDKYISYNENIDNANKMSVKVYNDLRLEISKIANDKNAKYFQLCYELKLNCMSIFYEKSLAHFLKKNYISFLEYNFRNNKHYLLEAYLESIFELQRHFNAVNFNFRTFTKKRWNKKPIPATPVVFSYNNPVETFSSLELVFSRNEALMLTGALYTIKNFISVKAAKKDILLAQRILSENKENETDPGLNPEEKYYDKNLSFNENTNMNFWINKEEKINLQHIKIFYNNHKNYFYFFRKLNFKTKDVPELSIKDIIINSIKTNKKNPEQPESNVNTAVLEKTDLQITAEYIKYQEENKLTKLLTKTPLHSPNPKNKKSRYDRFKLHLNNIILKRISKGTQPILEIITPMHEDISKALKTADYIYLTRDYVFSNRNIQKSSVDAIWAPECSKTIKEHERLDFLLQAAYKLKKEGILYIEFTINEPPKFNNSYMIDLIPCINEIQVLFKIRDHWYQNETYHAILTKR